MSEPTTNYHTTCTHCGAGMNEGYCIDSGIAYYCSEPCLHTVYTPEEWAAIADEDGDSYWTQWEPEEAEVEPQFELAKWGEVLFTGSEGDCYVKLQKIQSQSADWAMKHEGYSIDPVSDTPSMGDFDEKGSPNTFKHDEESFHEIAQTYAVDRAEAKEMFNNMNEADKAECIAFLGAAYHYEAHDNDEVPELNEMLDYLQEPEMEDDPHDARNLDKY